MTNDEQADVSMLREIIRSAISDCSTTDWYDISEDGVDNIAFVAARAVVQYQKDMAPTPEDIGP